MSPKFNLTSEIRGALRLIFRKSPHRKFALENARVELPKWNKDGSLAKKNAVWFRCAVCQKLFKPTELEIDHITPVGPAPGTRNAPDNLTWEQFLEKMFCGPENLQCVCKTCHRKKTKSDLVHKKNSRTKAVP